MKQAYSLTISSMWDFKPGIIRRTRRHFLLPLKSLQQVFLICPLLSTVFFQFLCATVFFFRIPLSTYLIDDNVYSFLIKSQKSIPPSTSW